MMPAGRRPRAMWLIGLALLAAGCGQDAEVLVRVGRKTMSKLEAVSQDAAGKLAPRLEAARAGCPDPTLAARVSCRLRWDQALAGASIEVQASEGKVELTGAVVDTVQHQRAVQLAETTVGVEQVIDSLTIVEPPH